MAARRFPGLGMHTSAPALDQMTKKVAKSAMPMSSQAAYREDLHRRFWDYRRTSFAAESDLFDPSHSEGKSPPVFRREFAERNLLLPSTAGSGIGAAITAMITKRQRWFASMSSSQALAQSVFAGLATLGRLDALENLASRDGYPAFFETADLYQLKLEHQVATLGEPSRSRTFLDVFFNGPRKVAVEVKFTETKFGRCSRPRLRPKDAGFAQYHCDGSFSVQRDRLSRCSLSERGILYWQFLPQFFTWSATQDHVHARWLSHISLSGTCWPSA
jgi:hypothetical protein